MDRDTNVLFAVLASRLHQSQWSAISDVLKAWQADASQPVADRLVAASVLSEQEKTVVAELVRQAVEAHGGDSSAALAAYGGGGALGASPHVFCLQGKTLADALAECTTLDERLRLLPQYASLCDAVGAGHSRGVIHRGLSPGAVLLTDYGETVISDWSLSITRGRQDHQRERFAKTAADPGMRPYLAPEIRQGGLDEADARSDVYALGAVLYHLLAGAPPDVAKNEPEPVEAVRPGVPHDLAQVCRRAMFGEASARYANASQLAESVRQHDVQHAPEVQAQPAQGVDPLYKTLLGATVLCLVVLAAALGFVYQSLSADRAEAVRIRDEEMELRRSAEEERDKLAAELDDADTIRTRIESERDHFEDAANVARAELTQVRDELRATKEQLIAAAGAARRAETVARLAAPEPPQAAPEQAAPERAAPAPAPAPPAVEETLPAEQPPAPAPEPAAAPEPEEAPPAEGAAEPVEPFSTPLPDVELMPDGEPPDAVTEPPSPAPPDTPMAPAPPPVPAIVKPDFAKAMPDLIGSVVAAGAEGAESQAAVRITDATPAAVKAMGFRDGDVITRINRSAVKTVGDAKRELENVRNDSGFSIRVTRDGRAGWMRINFKKPQPQQPAVEPAQAAEPAAAQASQ